MKTTFGLYGGGWRSEFFLRVARALPDRFEVSGVITRDHEKAARFGRDFGVTRYGTAAELLSATKPLFMVVCVNGNVSADVALDLLRRRVPVLMETPPAPNLETLLRFHESLPKDARIQIAEQYPFQPMHMARAALLATGKIGAVQHAHVSCAQGYHAMALMRRYLGVGFESAEITAKTFPVSVVGGFTRQGEPTEERVIEHPQTVAALDFGGKTGLFNFEANQHRSWARSQIVQIKGERGEIFNDRLKYLLDFKTPMESEIARKDLGRSENLEGADLKGVFADGQWLYRNPYQGSRLADDEIAVAACLDRMAEHALGGPPFYGFAEAAQDAYLALMIDKAAKNGIALRAESQPWAPSPP